MNKTTTYTFRLSPQIKQESIELFESLGITLSDAINMFLYQSLAEGGIPFDLKRTGAAKDREKAAASDEPLM